MTSETEPKPGASQVHKAWMAPPRLVAAAMVGMALLIGAVGIASNAEPFPEQSSSERTSTAVVIATPDVSDVEQLEGREREQPGAPGQAEIPRWLSVITVVLVAAGVLYLLSRQRVSMKFRRAAKPPESSIIEPPSEEDHAAEIVQVTRDLIEDLRDAADPREAIKQAYASVEDGFGVRNMGRKPAETPLKYMHRIFGQREDAIEPLSRLTQLFEIARFSQRPMDESMRAEAIDALSSIRDSYKSGTLFTRRNR